MTKEELEKGISFEEFNKRVARMLTQSKTKTSEVGE